MKILNLRQISTKLVSTKLVSTRLVSTKLVLFCLLYLVLAAVLFVKIPTGGHIDIDSRAYLNNAILFEDSGSFVHHGVTQCTMVYSIGYPAFIAMARYIAGKSEAAVVFFQMLLALLMIFFTFKLALHIFNLDIALLSAFLASINLGYLVYPQLILTETLLTLLLLVGFEQIIAYFKYEKIFNLIVAGLAWGLSIIVKAAAIYYVPCFILLFLMVSKNLKRTLIFTMAFMIPVGGYVLRNKNIYGYYYLKSIDRINLYYYFLPKILEVTDGIQYRDWSHRDWSHKDWSYNDTLKKLSLLSEVKELASGDRWTKIHEFFIETIKKHPVLAIKIWTVNMIKTLLGSYTNHLKVLLDGNLKGKMCSFFKLKGNFIDRVVQYVSFGTDSKFLIWLGVFEFVWNCLRYLAVLLGFFVLILNRKYLVFVLFSSYITYFTLITGHDGCARFRFKFEPLLIILSAVGLYRLVCYIILKRNKRCAVLRDI